MNASCTHLQSIELTDSPEVIAGREDCRTQYNGRLP
jgi:hypothetical protein